MNLSSTQKVTVKTWLDANAVGLSNDAAAAALNANASPDYWVWRSSITEVDVVQKTSVDGTTFTWVGNGFITRSVGEQSAWSRLFAVGINPSLPSVRTAFGDILSGTGNAAANRTHLLATARRKATVGEKLLATGTGSTASPGTLALFNVDPLIYSEGPISGQDVSDIRGNV